MNSKLSLSRSFLRPSSLQNTLRGETSSFSIPVPYAGSHSILELAFRIKLLLDRWDFEAHCSFMAIGHSTKADLVLLPKGVIGIPLLLLIS